MRRRDILALLGASAATAAGSAISQAANQLQRIGVLRFSLPHEDTLRDPLVRMLSRLGYVEGHNVTFEWRYSNHEDRIKELAAELVQLRADVIVAIVTPAARAAKNATTAIPIIAIVGDAVATGLVQSLAQPGGNVTGVSLAQAELNGKRLELLREIMPKLVHLGVLIRPSDPFSDSFVREARNAAAHLGVELHVVPIEQPEEIERAFQSLVQARAEAVLVQGVLRDHRGEIARAALAHRLPSIAEARWFPDAGGLLALGAGTRGIAQSTAHLIDKILKGARPADLPVEQPTTFDLVVNLKTANVLGLAIPLSVVFRADEVIE